jgi:hypothetical protein
MDDDATRERARGRWKILRNALLSKKAAVSQSAPSNDSDDDAEPEDSLHSIHCFAGFQMIPQPCPLLVSPTTVQDKSEDDEDKDMLVKLLRQELTRVLIHARNFNDMETLNRIALDLLCSLAAWQALHEQQQQQQQQPLPADSDTNYEINSVEWTIEADSGHSLPLPSSWQAILAEMLLKKGYHGTFVAETETTTMTPSATTTASSTTVLARGKIRPVSRILPTSQEYTLQWYTIPTLTKPNVAVLTRERRSQRPRTTHRRLLHELTSQVHHDGIDNTGNICVWDCERTLTWAVLQSHGFNHCPVVHPDHTTDILNDSTRCDPFVVLELGSGMAALAALSLAVRWSNHSQSQSPPGCSAPNDASPKMHVYITDGHDDSVFNNQVNVRLMQSAGLLNHFVSVECRKLLWTIEAQSHGLPVAAHVTLISDCTHFVEYHAELYWTAVHHTRVGGQIWMCQPHRGDSWWRFAHLIQHVNARDSMAQPLVSLVEPADIAQHLQSRHEEFQRESSVYNANIHRPHVFILTKLREATESDRVCVLQYQHGSHR